MKIKLNKNYLLMMKITILLVFLLGIDLSQINRIKSNFQDDSTNIQIKVIGYWDAG